MNQRGHYGTSWVGQPPPPQSDEKPATWGKWVVRGIGAAAVIGVGLMAHSAYKSMTRTDETFRSKGLKGPFGT